jgi:hypothetical protein
MKQELAKLGHRVRNIINIHHTSTNEPLNLFFVDLEPVPNNKKIYDVTGLQNRIVKIDLRTPIRQPSHNALDANNTDTQKPTAISHTSASNAAEHTKHQTARKQRTHQRKRPSSQLQRLR